MDDLTRYWMQGEITTEEWIRLAYNRQFGVLDDLDIIRGWREKTR